MIILSLLRRPCRQQEPRTGRTTDSKSHKQYAQFHFWSIDSARMLTRALNSQEPSIAKALCPSDSPSSVSPSYGGSAVGGSLSDACRGQESWRGAQDNFSTPYVNSNLSGSEDARVPPMGSLGYPEGTLGPVSAPAPLARVAPLAAHYPTESVPAPISIPPSPLRLTPTSYYLAVSTGDSSPTNRADEAYHSPDPGSPSSITLYPVPQAPLNHHHTIPSWSPHQISPEPVPAPREASVSRSTKRKRGKDSDKKPPLACLFCRGRKIACGPPPPDGDGKTCKYVLFALIHIDSQSLTSLSSLFQPMPPTLSEM